MMSRWLTGCVLLVLVALGRAQDQPATSTPAKKATKGEQAFKALLEELKDKLKGARAPAARREVFDAYTEKFLDHAKEHSADASGVSALLVVMELNSRDKGDAYKTALEKLKKDYANDQLIRPALRQLAMKEDEDCTALVKQVLAGGPDRRTQVEAARALVYVLEGDVRRATKIRANPKHREAWEKSRGEEWVRKFLAANDGKRRQLKEYQQLLKTKYNDLVQDVTIGARAPETLGEDLEGKKVKLSDYKGKVVVLDFWATWCGPCIGMIPNTRKVVESMKDRPFVMVSVSVDDEKEDVTKFHKKRPMPWEHWWTGKGGPVADLWDAYSYPTVYVIDHKGVIRHKEVGFDKEDKSLEEAIEKLVKAAEEDGKKGE